MITLPPEQDVNRRGKRALRSVFEPLRWVVNDTQEDFGIDSNVQVFDGRSPNGAWFHVQLKSSASPDYSGDGTFISQSLDVDHARYYALELRNPVFLIFADVTAGRVFWHCPQTDSTLIQHLQNHPDAKSVTLRIPTANLLPDSIVSLLVALNAAYLILATRELLASDAMTFAESLTHFPDQERLNREFQEKNDALKLTRAKKLFNEGKYEEARTRAVSIVGDLDSTVEVKFWAQMQIHAIDFATIFQSGKTQGELPMEYLAHAMSLQALTRSGPNYLKFYALIVRKAAELWLLVYENTSLYMLQKAHTLRGGNPSVILDTYVRRALLSKAIVAKYNQCVRLARYAANYHDRWMLGRALAEVVNATAHYRATLNFENSVETEESFSRSATQISKLAVWISQETGDETGVALATLSVLNTVRSKDTDAYRWAEGVMATIQDETVRDDLREGIERQVQRWNGEDVAGDYVGDTIWQIFQNMAAGLGIDISDEQSPFVRALRIAARDDSPERVLINCEHLAVSFGAIGPLASQVFALFNTKTAASKVVHCMLHSFHVEGRELDVAYQEFKTAHCDGCKDRTERPAGWKHSGKPTEREAEFLVNIFGTPYGARLTDED